MGKHVVNTPNTKMSRTHVIEWDSDRKATVFAPTTHHVEKDGRGDRQTHDKPTTIIRRAYRLDRHSAFCDLQRWVTLGTNEGRSGPTQFQQASRRSFVEYYLVVSRRHSARTPTYASYPAIWYTIAANAVTGVPTPTCYAHQLAYRLIFASVLYSKMAKRDDTWHRRGGL